MDDTDLAICRTFLRNSRTSYSDLGVSLGISPQAVHRRVQMLIDSGIILGFNTNLSFYSSGLMWVVIFGFSRHNSMNQLSEYLRKNESIALMMFASGNYVYIHAGVKDANEMASVVSYVQSEADLMDMHVGIMPGTLSADGPKLNLLDLKIVNSLKEDSRKSVASIAEELGSTAKTIRRRLQRLIDEDLVHFSIYWRPDTLGNVISNIHFLLEENSKTEDVLFSLIRRQNNNITRVYSFSNIPQQIIITHWDNTMRDLWAICEEWESQGIFKNVTPHIIRGVYYFEDPRKRAFNVLMDEYRNKSSNLC